MGKVLPKRRTNTIKEATSPLGLAIRNARVAKQIPQRVIAEALASKCGGEPTNVRVSCFELDRKLPSDAELTVLAQMLGLSVVSLRELREASRRDVKKANKERYEHQVATGVKTPSFRMKPRGEARAAPASARVPKAKAQEPAGVPMLADLVEQIDEIAPMPADKDARKRWFHCVTMLSRIGAAS
jgi:hypothetical protein